MGRDLCSYLPWRCTALFGATGEFFFFFLGGGGGRVLERLHAERACFQCFQRELTLNPGARNPAGCDIERGYVLIVGERVGKVQRAAITQGLKAGSGAPAKVHGPPWGTRRWI